MSGWLPAIAIGLSTAVLATVLKQYRTDFAVVVSVIGGAVMIFSMLRPMQTVIGGFSEWLERSALSGLIGGRMIRALGIAVVTEWAADSCRDAGETALANKSEWVGKIAITVVSLPVLQEILTTVETLLQRME